MKFILAACALVVCSWSGSASAKIIEVSYTGLIESGTDPSGVFETGSGNLTGDIYTATFDIDTSKGVYASQTTCFPQAGCRYYDSSISGANASNPISGSLKIGSTTAALGTGAGSETYSADLHDGLGTFSQDFTGTSAIGANEFATTLDEFTYAISAYGGEQFYDPVLGGPDIAPEGPVPPLQPYPFGSFSVGDASGSFNLSNFSYHVVSDIGGPSGAPEVSTWILMLSGIAMTGGALRLRSSRRGKLPVHV